MSWQLRCPPCRGTISGAVQPGPPSPHAIIGLLTGLLRLPVLLHYGVESLFVFLWISAALLLYKATTRILPLIIGHIG